MMATRFDRYYERQMESSAMRALVEKELEALEVGIQIARAREAEHLNQTQLAARAGMNASKISRLETSPQNVTLATLTRIAAALNRTVTIDFAPAKEKKAHKRR